MGFVEFLRVRKAFTIFAIVLALGAGFTTGSVEYGLHQGLHTVRLQEAHRLHERMAESSARDSGPTSLADLKFTIPLAWITGVAVFSVMIFTTIVSTSLNKENGRGGFAFTKPISRDRLAIAYMAIDAAAVAIAYLYTIAVILVCLGVLGIAGKIVADSAWLEVAASGLGAAFMWYGILQAATALRASPGGLFAGLSWPVFIVALALYQVAFFGPIFHAAIAVVDFFNPLAYFGLSGNDDSASSFSLFGFSAEACIAITWSIAVAACAVAIFEWKRVEV
jgi:hypothetical protein